MALITCPECGREVSDKAAACPYCGNPLKENPETEMSTKADAVSAAQKRITSNGRSYYGRFMWSK